MWLCRDENGTLSLIADEDKPSRCYDNSIDDGLGYWSANQFAEFNDDCLLFDDIDWKDEPIECDIVIKKPIKKI